MGMSDTSSNGASRGRAGMMLVVGTAVLLLTHAVLQGVAAGGFWRPCFEAGYNSEVCMYLQYEAPTPWWAHLSWLWPIEMVLLITVLVVARGSRLRAWPALAALVLVAVCNVLTDYVLTPAFNGGYISADAAPGFGIVGGVGVGLAGCVLLFALVLRSAHGREEPPAAPAGHTEAAERAGIYPPARSAHDRASIAD
jgi:hypothetical protein